LCLGSTASINFIGGAKNNFSDQRKILFRTLWSESAQLCPEAVQSPPRNASFDVWICFTLLSGFGSCIARGHGPPGAHHQLKFVHKKIGGKRMPLAAIGIDFNRILLSA
jgi:hypothetical protein